MASHAIWRPLLYNFIIGSRVSRSLIFIKYKEGTTEQSNMMPSQSANVPVQVMFSNQHGVVTM